MKKGLSPLDFFSFFFFKLQTFEHPVTRTNEALCALPNWEEKEEEEEEERERGGG
jgi:hypothetical protein